jgi:hypothetical protein
MKASKENDDAPKITGFLQCRRDAAHGRTPEPCVSAPAAESSSSALVDPRRPTDISLELEFLSERRGPLPLEETDAQKTAHLSKSGVLIE